MIEFIEYTLVNISTGNINVNMLELAHLLIFASNPKAGTTGKYSYTDTSLDSPHDIKQSTLHDRQLKLVIN